MAWRIDEAVLRGEIDNRVRGRVTGRIWFAGRAEPVELDLAGDAWRDLAGRRLEFSNPDPKSGDLKGLAARQTGTVGDLTASRKVKVPEVSMDELMKLFEQRKPFPWHWGNSLYLEWFSATNGRVVIESAAFQLTVSSDIAWDMTAAEEETQRGANAEAMGGFMERLGEAGAADRAAKGEPVDDPPAEWDEHKPQTEVEAEKMQADSDRLSDRIQARLDREGPGADYRKILEEEIERRSRERGEKPLTPEAEAKRAEWIDEMNRAGEEALKNPDPELEAEIDTKHPLAERASDLAVRVMEATEERNWIPADASREHPVVELTGATMSAAAKFSGGLNGETWPPPADGCAGKIVRLKRARGYLDDALLAAESCAQQNLTEAGWLAETQRELQALAAAGDEVIEELRARLQRGFD